jgi:hypothetical protein
MMKKRRARSDRTHLLYVITNQVTGEQYVGLTVKNATVFRTLKRRIQKHVQRALAEDKGWALSASIRDHGPDAFTFGFLEAVRGRKPAHQREREYIRQFQPQLNTF